MQTRGVHVDYLKVIGRFYTENLMTSRLRLFRGDTQLLTQYVVEQRALTYVRSAYYRDVATTTLNFVLHLFYLTQCFKRLTRGFLLCLTTTVSDTVCRLL